MKPNSLHNLLLLMAGLNFSLAFSQQQAGFKPLRYEDDFSYLRNDTAKTAYEKLKFLQVGNEARTYVSLGGELRYQYFNIKNEDWGDAPLDRDGYTLSRHLFHADFHSGSNFRLFLQLQGSSANGRVNPNPIENNPLDLHQAFVDFKFIPGLNFRAGRQELSYGSQRLIAVRELPNSRSAFDGLKLMWNAGEMKSDVFYSHPVMNRKGNFDDHFNQDSKFWGSYTVMSNIPLVKNIDLYYLGLWKRNAVFDDGSGEEIRHSAGIRIWKNKGSLRYDFEGIYQFGKLEKQDISAWTVSSNTSYRLYTLKYRPTFGLKTEIISGNKTYDDGKIETFNALFPRGAYFGLAALIGPSNLMDIHPYVNFEISKKLNLSFDYDAFWRFSKNDGLYAANTQLIYSGSNRPERYIGSQLGMELAYQYSDMLFFKIEGTWFQSGKFINESGSGKDIAMGGITTQFKF